MCALARPYQGDAMCLMGAAMTTVKNFKSGVQAAAICDTTTLGLRPSCYYAAGSVMDQYALTAPVRERNCRAATPFRRLRQACVRGGVDSERLNGNQLFLIHRRFAQLLPSKGEARALALAIADVGRRT